MMKSIAIVVVAAQSFPDVIALRALRCASLVCWDLKPHYCCSTGSCSIFCCNCDDRCENPYGLPTQRDPYDEVFSLADSAGNGNLILDRKLTNSQKVTDSGAGI